MQQLEGLYLNWLPNAGSTAWGDPHITPVFDALGSGGCPNFKRLHLISDIGRQACMALARAIQSGYLRSRHEISIGCSDGDGDGDGDFEGHFRDELRQSSH